MIVSPARVYETDLEDFVRLSTGIDSNVFRIGDRVAKEYQRLSFAGAERYSSLQNAAADALATLPYRAEIDSPDGVLAIVAEQVIRVDELAMSRAGLPLAFARYVEAPNWEKLTWPPDRFAAYVEQELSDPGLIAFATHWNKYFWHEYPTRVKDELDYHICMLSRTLDEALGTSGLYLSKYNVKLHPAADESRIDLIVTDLALYIERVSFGYAVNGAGEGRYR